MNAKKVLLIVGIIAVVLAVVTGVVIKKLIGGPAPTTTDTSVIQQQGNGAVQEPLDPAIKVAAVWSTAKANTVTLSVSGMASKVSTIAYEFSYDSQGLVKGVVSGSNPISVAGQDAFSRDVYLGTCSKNDCRPDTGVNKVSVVVEFNNTDGKQSQYSGDFTLTPGAAAPATTVTPHPVSD